MLYTHIYAVYENPGPMNDNTDVGLDLNISF